MVRPTVPAIDPKCLPSHVASRYPKPAWGGLHSRLTPPPRPACLPAVAERSEALTTMMAISQAQALQLYRQLPGLLCYPSLEVAYRVKGLCRALHMGSEALLPLLARDPRLAFLDPEVVEARCGQVAKLCGMRLPAAAHLLAANGDVLLARNNRLLRRWGMGSAGACRCLPV